jgi:acetate kinase
MAISGLSSDLRDIEDAAAEGHQRAQLALEMYTYRIRKYIGAYAAAMNGVDVIVFTAGVGENGPIQRAMICPHLSYLGAQFDPSVNDFKAQEREISTPSSRVKLWVIPTNEELMIARDTMMLAKTS